MDAKNRRQQSEERERWLDLALRERAHGEPRNGLDERVLARLATEPRERGFAWWPVWAASAAVFVIVLTLLLIYPRHPDQVVHEQPPTGSPANPPQASLPGSRQPTRVARGSSDREAACCVARRTMAKRSGGVQIQPEPMPKLATFPALRPETTEERLLAQLAGQPEIAAIASISNEPQALNKLSIPELKIDPMEGTPPDDVQQEEFGRKDASQQRK